MKWIYSLFGFDQIETPCMERMGNLQSNQGDDSEQLMFRVMKRGEKLLSVPADSSLDDLVNCGLRYDLTVPLSRYYARNAEKLPLPFRAMQMGPVWRADKPQQGRCRQFYQADIDIIGDDSVNAEIELVCATSLFMREIDMDSRVRINDRRLLVALAAACGFERSKYSAIFATMGKLDEVGLEGVCVELLNNGYTEECVTTYRSTLESFDGADDKLAYCESILAPYAKDEVLYCEMALAPYAKYDVLANLRAIIAGVEIVSEGAVIPELDLSLVRETGYYKGTIFEVESTELKSSIAEGGRYDRMVGRFVGKDVPACGFTVDFEKIIQLLLEKKAANEAKGALRNMKNVWDAEGGGSRLAILYNRNQKVEQVTTLQRGCQRLREEGIPVLLLKKAENLAHQKEQLSRNHYGISETNNLRFIK